MRLVTNNPHFYPHLYPTPYHSPMVATARIQIIILPKNTNRRLKHKIAKIPCLARSPSTSTISSTTSSKTVNISVLVARKVASEGE